MNKLIFKGSYAGIGSRKTPREILNLMERIGQFLSDKSMILRSGGAPGADSAFEKYAQPELKEIFLPWKMFNDNKSNLTTPNNDAFEIAKQIHPNWSKCSKAAKKLHARNIHQVLGLNLKSPINFVIYWAETKNGVIQGGTATAVNLATKLNIPTFNLLEKEIQENWENIIKKEKKTKKPKSPDSEIVKDFMKIS